MDTIDPILKLIAGLWDRITHAPMHLLLIVVLNVVGVMLKRIPQVPNRTIPLILITLATLAYPQLASPGDVSPDVRHPVVVLGMFGFLLGFGAWMLHLFILRRAAKLLPDWMSDQFDPPVAPLLVGLLPLLAGCATVPETVIRYDKQKEGVVISSPKDVEIARASIVVESNRIVKIDFEGYKAKNSIEVIRAVAERNQAALENAAKVGGALMGEVIGHMK